jgi:hypothetical protein
MRSPLVAHKNRDGQELLTPLTKATSDENEKHEKILLFLAT